MSTEPPATPGSAGQDRITATAAWDAAKHNAEYGHCAKCGADLIESFGADGSVIVSGGWCNTCGVTTVWSVTDVT